MPLKLWREELGRLVLFKGEEGIFRVTKIKKDSNCNGCEKTIKKGCYCLGGGYSKICLDCANKFINNFNSSLEELKEN